MLLVGGRPPGLMSGGGEGERDTLPCDLSSDAFDVTYPPPPPTCGQTDACENITLSQLRLWAVNIRQYPVVVVSEAILLVMAPKSVFTARKRSLRRLCFHRCLSVCPRGGCLPHCMMGYTPPADTPWAHPAPPWADTHPRHTPPSPNPPPPGTHPLPQPPPRADTLPPGQTPPRQTPPPVL